MSVPFDQENVRAFMHEARLSRLQDDISMRGRPHLSNAQRLAIRVTATSAVVAGPLLNFGSEIKIALLERFEEMCRRQQIEVPEQMRAAILETMLTELWVNQKALKAKPNNLVSVTAYCGAIGQNLDHEFPDLAGTPYVFHQAMVGHPTDPRGFLYNMQTTLAALKTDDEFAEFRDRPFIYTQAAAFHSTDARGFLRKVKGTITELMADEEFREFRDKPYILLRVAISYKNPRNNLRRLQRISATLAADDEFAEFRDRPSTFLYAAFSYSEDPRKFLRDVHKTIVELTADEEFAHLHDKQYLIEEAAIHHPTDPRVWLRAEHGADRHVLRVNQKRGTRPGSNEPNR